MLKPTERPFDTENLIVVAYGNLTEAVGELRDAQRVDQSLEERAAAKERAVAALGCLVAHFQGALDGIPDEAE
jgi:hypothetical protein